MTKSLNTIKNLVAVLVVMAIAAASVSASGLGQGHYFENGANVKIYVDSEPHQDVRQIGYVGEDGEVYILGETTEGVTYDLGYFEPESVLIFCLVDDVKGKMYYTGNGGSTTTSDQFTINGTKFNIDVEEGNSEMVGAELISVETKVISSNVDSNDCSDPSIDYIPGKKVKLQMFKNNSTGIYQTRIVFKTDEDNNWNDLHDGEVTVEVTFNDECSFTVSVDAVIENFIREDKNYEGYRLAAYLDTIPVTVTTSGKQRLTIENGIFMGYTYLNYYPIWELVGETVNVKVRIYQDGELISAVEFDGKVDQLIK